jgi:hypothetical protein
VVLNTTVVLVVVGVVVFGGFVGDAWWWRVVVVVVVVGWLVVWWLCGCAVVGEWATVVLALVLAVVLIVGGSWCCLPTAVTGTHLSFNTLFGPTAVTGTHSPVIEHTPRPDCVPGTHSPVIQHTPRRRHRYGQKFLRLWQRKCEQTLQRTLVHHGYCCGRRRVLSRFAYRCRGGTCFVRFGCVYWAFNPGDGDDDIVFCHAHWQRLPPTITLPRFGNGTGEALFYPECAVSSTRAHVSNSGSISSSSSSPSATTTTTTPTSEHSHSRIQER